MVLVQTPEEIEAAREAAQDAAEVLSGANGRIAESFRPDASAGQEQGVATSITNVFSDAINVLSFIAIGLGVLAVVLTGIYIISGVAANNSGNAAANLRRVIWVLGGLVVVFAAVPIVSLALSITT